MRSYEDLTVLLLEAQTEGAAVAAASFTAAAPAPSAPLAASLTTPPFIDAVQSGDMSQLQAFLDDNAQIAFLPELISAQR